MVAEAVSRRRGEHRLGRCRPARPTWSGRVELEDPGGRSCRVMSAPGQRPLRAAARPLSWTWTDVRSNSGSITVAVALIGGNRNDITRFTRLRRRGHGPGVISADHRAPTHLPDDGRGQP